MMQIDHIALGAIDIHAAADGLCAQFGVEFQPGGKHAAMSTHNRLARLGGQSYLEVIGIDPDAPRPSRRRWFSLDDPMTQARIAATPTPLCWVVATDDLDGLVAASPVDLGEILTLSRDRLSWRLTVPSDGSLPCAGLLPVFIEWPPGAHPADSLTDNGLRLREIVVEHPDSGHLRHLLKRLGVDHLVRLVDADQPRLGFRLSTPRGTFEL